MPMRDISALKPVTHQDGNVESQPAIRLNSATRSERPLARCCVVWFARSSLLAGWQAVKFWNEKRWLNWKQRSETRAWPAESFAFAYESQKKAVRLVSLKTCKVRFELSWVEFRPMSNHVRVPQDQSRSKARKKNTKEKCRTTCNSLSTQLQQRLDMQPIATEWTWRSLGREGPGLHNNLSLTLKLTLKILVAA